MFYNLNGKTVKRIFNSEADARQWQSLNLKSGSPVKIQPHTGPLNAGNAITFDLKESPLSFFQTNRTSPSTQTTRPVGSPQSADAAERFAASRNNFTRPAGIPQGADAAERWLTPKTPSTTLTTKPVNTIPGGSGGGGPTRAESIQIIANRYEFLGWKKNEAMEIAKFYQGFINKGWSDDQILRSGKLHELSVYKNMFKGNENRAAKLSDEEYLSVKRTMREAMMFNSNLLPASLRKQDGSININKVNDAADKLIELSIDGPQLEERFTKARNIARSIDPNLKTALKQYYNIGDDELGQWALSDEVDQEQWIQQYNVTTIGAESLNQGLQVQKALLTELVEKGISTGGAVSAFGNVSADKATYGLLSGLDTNLYATEQDALLSQEDLVKAETGLSGELAQRTRKLRDKELARFSGRGAGTDILGGGTSGMI